MPLPLAAPPVAPRPGLCDRFKKDSKMIGSNTKMIK